MVGVIPAAVDASRPELAKQALVLSAHFDHLGVRSDVPEGEDAVFNGADDDASGCAAVLELAGTWQGREAPARPIVLLLATGEERGLLGTRYYLQHPPVPLAETLCNVNFEMIGRPDAKVGGPGVLWLSGFERSNLGPACDELGLAVLDPASGRWEREPPGPASVVGERMVVRGRRVAWVGRGTLVCGSLQLEGGRGEGQRAVAGAFEDVHLGASGEVIAGNTRLKAAEELSAAEVPVAWFEGSDLDAAAYSIADNRTHEFAEWDQAGLARILEELRAEDALEGVGFSSDEINDLLAELERQVEPGDVDAYLGLARAYFRKGDLGSALGAARNATRVAPTSREARSLMMEMLRGP